MATAERSDTGVRAERLPDRVTGPVLRISLGVVFVWFGVLKVVGDGNPLPLNGNGEFVLKNLVLVCAAPALFALAGQSGTDWANRKKPSGS